MGDYGLGINTSDRALSPVDFNQISSNQSLFSPGSVSTKQSTMQDDTLHVGEQTAGKQQQLSPNGKENGREDSLDDSLNIKTQPEQQNGTQDEKKNNNVGDSVNSVITSLNQLGLSEQNNAVITSLNTSVPSFWSSATTEDTFIQGFPMNGAVTFPNFPGANPLFNNVGAQMPQQMGLGPGSLPQQQAARRPITGQTPGFPQQRPTQQQPNMFLGNTKTYPTWSSAPQQSSWSQQQSQTAGLNPWANMQQQQRRTMPNVGPIGAPGKKPNLQSSSMPFSPSKFRMPQPGMGGKGGLDFGGMEDHRDASGLLGMQQVSLPSPHYAVPYYDTRVL